MAEKTYRSPGFFEREIDLTDRVAQPSGVPAGIIGTSIQGPAFVPVTVATFNDFATRFGSLDPDRFGPYAVREFLANRNSLTFMRVLGAGANQSLTDISTTLQQGTVKNAGFYISGSSEIGGAPNAGAGFVQFIVADHDIQPAASASFPAYSQNASNADDVALDPRMNMVRAMIMFATGTRGMVTGSEVDVPTAFASLGAFENVAGYAGSTFKMIISSSDGTAFDNDDGLPGLRILTASLNPRSDSYIAKVLNTDPLQFSTKKHVLYCDFLVDNEVAPVAVGTAGGAPTVAIVSGSSLTSAASGDATMQFLETFGRFDTRYTTPTTSWFISQPFGTLEYNLFRFETLSDGAYGNDKFKVSIANIRASTNDNDPYGTFEVQVRRLNDLDTDPEIVESFPGCSLNPASERYVARLIGDRKVRFDFDSDQEEEKRLLVTGKYPNRSAYVRVIVDRSVDKADVPAACLPFGFRGVPVVKTSNSLTDLDDTALVGSDGKTLGAAGVPRLAANAVTYLTSSVLPPMPYRTKVTRGTVNTTTAGFLGDPGPAERTDARLYWGVQAQRLVENNLTSPNIGTALNPLVTAYTKFQGIMKLDALVTGTAADEFNSNKFTLARVALNAGSFTNVTASAADHMKEAAYVRNGTPVGSTYVVVDPLSANNRITMATLVHSSSVVFNRFTAFNKFTNVFYGGFDGTNILDRDNYYMTDRGSSGEAGGKAGEIPPSLGLNSSAGSGIENNLVASYRLATKLMTDEFNTRINLLAIPGIRDSFVTDYAADQARDYGLAMYVMDIPNYGINRAGSEVRMFGDNQDETNLRPDVRSISENFEDRAIDNNYVATYFPDVVITDPINANRRVKVPASVAAMAALGFNDRVAYPWFAPAGFNRAALAFVNNTTSRLYTEDRDTLYDARVNPIASFPSDGSSRRQFVIFGQKTLQLTQSALDRVNVRRLLIEVKRAVKSVAQTLLFEQNTAETRARFVKLASPQLSLIQAQQGLESFRVIADASNNTDVDVQQYRMNARIVLVPTRTIEFIAIDFIIDPTGVTFL